MQQYLYSKNMYCNVMSYDGKINTVIFLKYFEEKEKLELNKKLTIQRYPLLEGDLLEYVLEWNPKFRMDDVSREECNFPIRIQRKKVINDRWKRVVNPLFVQFDLLRSQTEVFLTRPFLGIKRSDDATRKYEAICLGVLDCENIKIVNCI